MKSTILCEPYFHVQNLALIYNIKRERPDGPKSVVVFNLLFSDSSKCVLLKDKGEMTTAFKLVQTLIDSFKQEGEEPQPRLPEFLAR